MTVARKEAREARYWLRLIEAEQLLPSHRMLSVIDESDQLVRIIATIITRTKENAGKSKHDEIAARDST